jgi:hypothetical protein
MNPQLSAEDLTCSTCGLPQGHTNAEAQGIHLSKYSLLRETSGPAPTIPAFLTSTLISLCDRQNVRKFILYPATTTTSSTSSPDPAPAEGLHLWLFAPSLIYAAAGPSAAPGIQHAAKILYQSLTGTQTRALVDQSSPNTEDLPVSAFVYDAVRAALVGSTASLPESARAVMGWSVGMLERFVDGGQRGGERGVERGV